MSITESDIKTITSLANLDIDSGEIENFAQDLSGILELIHQMRQIDTSQVEPMSHPQDLQLRLRPDIVTEPDQRMSLQTIAPSTENGLYIVPKVLD